MSSSKRQGEDGLALTERRWNEVSNLREASQTRVPDETPNHPLEKTSHHRLVRESGLFAQQPGMTIPRKRSLNMFKHV